MRRHKEQINPEEVGGTGISAGKEALELDLTEYGAAPGNGEVLD